jgi:glycosyltransferase involved in cell wall biosynthesis
MSFARELSMRILMLTNTYLPHVGGVARSVAAFAAEYRRLGHEVLVIAPEFEDVTDSTSEVIRVPAIQKFNGSDFSLPVPSPGKVHAAVADFRPEVVHSHHPFFMGATAMRVARGRNLPLVFTHHTMYDQYTHYVHGESAAFSRFTAALTAGYCNLCDAIVAPSQSVADMLRQREVSATIEVIPTGVDVAHFQHGDGRAIREELRIPQDAFVIGHVGRLAPEKNLEFLAEAVATFLDRFAAGRFLVVGSGSCEEVFRVTFDRFALGHRLHMAGTLEGQKLIDAYHAMDLFAFASQTETQGMVVTEAMAAGLPVVALDGSGVREVVVDKSNGRLLPRASVPLFAQGLGWIATRTQSERQALQTAAEQTAERLSMARCARRALKLYDSLRHPSRPLASKVSPDWGKTRRRLEAEWTLWSNLASAATAALEPS